MSRGKFPRPGCPCRDTRNPCSFCAVAIFVNLGTDLRDQPLQALNTKANLSRHIIMLNQNKAYRCHFNKKKCRYSLISSNFNLGATWWFISTMAYCSISGLVTKKIDSFADTSLVDVCSCVVVSHMMNHCRLNDILCRLFQVLCRLKHIIGLCLPLCCSDRCRHTWIIEALLYSQQAVVQ